MRVDTTLLQKDKKCGEWHREGSGRQGTSFNGMRQRANVFEADGQGLGSRATKRRMPAVRKLMLLILVPPWPIASRVRIAKEHAIQSRQPWKQASRTQDE
jgi:hypothetical protein